ncbi:hypothetical protein GCM10009714_32840 [Microlunatus capsulatus]
MLELPDRALTWASGLAPAAVVDATPVGGGITGTKWLLRLADGGPLVVRWCDPAAWGATGREHVRREALACRLLAGTDLPVPRLLGTDPDGEHAGGPANLLTWRPGRVRLDPLDASALTAWARLAVAVHRQPVPAGRRPPPAAFRGPARPEVPGWVRWPGLWRRALEIGAAGPPAGAAGLLHRDFHLGNTVWEGDAVTGLVDWAETSWGAPDLDVAHACADLAMLHGTAAAVAFRTAYVEQGGRLDPDPDVARRWVVGDVLGFLPDPAHILPAVAAGRPDLTADAVRRGLEDLLALTLA